ncbi:MAG: TIGR02611 family protein [Candidatus Microsaccharimonas sp.]
MKELRRHTKKVLIGIVGGLVVLIGLILVPYPGPGWLIVFGGLAILATEFQFAAKTLEFAKGKYDAWVDWLKRQNPFIKTVVLLATAIVVVLTVWLLNGFGIINSLLSLNQEWLVSPLFR